MFNYVRFSDGGRPNVAGEMRSEVDLIASIAMRILPEGRFDWTAISSHQELRAAIAECVTGHQQIAQPEGSRKEFQIPGRTFHAGSFATPSGRAACSVVALPAPVAAAGQFGLMTIRSEGQFNSVVYDEEDLYRGNTSREVVMMCAADAADAGLNEGDLVTVTSEIGTMSVKVSLVDISRRSVAMYYPEANAIVPRRLDPKSLTPAFKSVPVTISR
jgi:anaerobic selenocysteine-containing dehydrogenase